jgi:hypothetical protein
MKKFEDKLIAEFQDFEHEKFHVAFMPPKVFLCGGEVDVKALVPKSLRDRLIGHFSAHEDELHHSRILAEDFKDYFKEGAYSDLLEFETDIANIATLIVICLESAGSLVELGLFCMAPTTASKLLIIAPQEELADEDSFIFLGPLDHIKRNNPGAVVAYPWPSSDLLEYEHIELVVGDIKQKLEKMKKTQKFSENNSAHIAFLIYDIIILAESITITEIEYALMAFKLEIDGKTVSRLLYLLEKIGLIAHTVYSNVVYFYDSPGSTRRIKFGTDVKGRTRDSQALTMALRSAYTADSDDSSKRRVLVLKSIKQIKAGIK